MDPYERSRRAKHAQRNVLPRRPTGNTTVEALLDELAKRRPCPECSPNRPDARVRYRCAKHRG